jgi:uncharacterized cupin superfamily protein
MSVPEAPRRDGEHGSVVEGEGWFVLNVREAQGLDDGYSGTFTRFEAREARFADFGINVSVLLPGKPGSMYHRENVQESFLVLEGECLLLVEEQERLLQAWDFVHCPAGTAHVFVGGGDGPCVVLMAGARREDRTVHYPVSEAAARYGAPVTQATDSPREAYRDWPGEFTPARMPWPR